MLVEIIVSADTFHPLDSTYGVCSARYMSQHNQFYGHGMSVPSYPRGQPAPHAGQLADFAGPKLNCNGAPYFDEL